MTDTSIDPSAQSAYPSTAPEVLPQPTAPAPRRVTPGHLSTGRVVLVQGGLWGSESKGLATAYLTDKYRADAVIRTGCINAGHTVVTKDTGPVVLQQLPCGWTHPNTTLVLGPGTYINPETLSREIALLESKGIDVRSRLLIDYRCGLHLDTHMVRARNADRHTKMGATGKGSSEAVVDKIRNRGLPEGRLLFQTPYGDPFRQYLTDTVTWANHLVDAGGTVILEATQGTLLDLHLGPYPYTTHKPTSPGMWLAEAGLSPSLLKESWLVVRSYPIRVAGNSGPMPGECEWADVARSINRAREAVKLGPLVPEADLLTWEGAVDSVLARHGGPTSTGTLRMLVPSQWSPAQRVRHAELLSNVHKLAADLVPFDAYQNLRRLFEFTTVTKKLRRVATLDPDTLYRSALVNRPTHVFFTFANYLWPEWWYAYKANHGYRPGNRYPTLSGPTRKAMHQYASTLKSITGAEVGQMSFGPDHQLHTVELGQ